MLDKARMKSLAKAARELATVKGGPEGPDLNFDQTMVIVLLALKQGVFVSDLSHEINIVSKYRVNFQTYLKVIRSLRSKHVLATIPQVCLPYNHDAPKVVKSKYILIVVPKFKAQLTQLKSFSKVSFSQLN
jgi:hypothetical protein